MSRKRYSTKPDQPARQERYVQWRNDTKGMIEPTIRGIFIPLWMRGVTKSMPESWSSDAESLGLTRVGYSQ